MRHIIYYASALVLVLGLAGCDKSDNPGFGDDMQQVDGIVLGLGELTETSAGRELSAQAMTRATVGGVSYAVNTIEDPTFTHGTNLTTARGSWKLDLHLFNNDIASSVKYADGSFDGGEYDGGVGGWIPNPYRQLLFPNYFHPDAEAWLYPVSKEASVVMDQSAKADFLAQDLLYRPKSKLTIEKKITVQLQHQRAMINFRFEDIVRSDIDEGSVRVRLGSDVYTPYNVRTAGVLECMLILPETVSTSAGMTVEYSTKGNPLQQPIQYVQKVTLNNDAALGRNNCYCFTLSGKEMKISPVIIVNWVTGEPVSGEYVAVTAYPTFKGPKNTDYYFYYDNKLTADGTLAGTPKLQKINFNNDGECTIKPDGRLITHIFKTATPSEADWSTYELAPADRITLGGYTAKMYIDLTTIIADIDAR